MSTHRFLTHGESGNLDFTLTEAPGPIDLTGATVSLVLTEADGTLVAAPGGVSVIVPTAGTIRWTPASSAILDKAKSPYSAHFKVTVAGRDSYFPSGDAEVWEVSPQ